VKPLFTERVEKLVQNQPAALAARRGCGKRTALHRNECTTLPVSSPLLAFAVVARCTSIV